MMQLAVAEAQRSRGGLRRLIQAFLRDFNSRAHGIAEAAACIREQLNVSDDGQLAHCAWHNGTFSCLIRGRGAKSLGRACSAAMSRGSTGPLPSG